MPTYRIRSTDLQKAGHPASASPRLVTVRSGADGVILEAATVDDFPDVFDAQQRRAGKRLTILHSTVTDPFDGNHVLCEVVEMWVPFDEQGKINVRVSPTQMETAHWEKRSKGG